MIFLLGMMKLKTAVQIHSETDAFNSAEAEKLAAPFVKDDAQNKILMQALITLEKKPCLFLKQVLI